MRLARPLETLLGGICLICAHTAPAQDALPGAAVEEIVVTAQRREQKLSEVPITIAAFDADRLREAGIRDLEDAAALVSNAQIFQNNGSGAPVWIIRGVGIVDFNTNNTPAAAVYLDDIYQVSSVFGSIALFDIERVEVLKGPQGGLYGRNTSGGAVRVVTRSPDLTAPTGELVAGYGRWGRYNVEGGASIPLIDDKLAVRFSGKLDRSDDGWQYSIPAARNHGKLDAYAVRGQLLARPTDNFDARLIVDAGSDNSEFVLPRARGYYAAGTAGYPPTCPAILQGYNDDACLTFDQALTGGGLGAELQSDDGRRVLADPFSRNNNDTLGVTAIANLDLGGLTLTSVSGYRDFDFKQRQENDGIPGEWGHQISGSYFEAYSQEFRLASAPDQRLTWIAGASYGRDTLQERRLFLARDNIYFAAIFGSPLIFTLDYDQETVSWAGFGQADYALSDTLTLSGALRYTDEHKEYRNGGIGLPGIDNIFATPLSDDYDLGERWSGKISLSWRASEDSMLYASASRGFKSGGFFGGFGFSGQASIAPYTEEVVNALEIGAKNTLLDDRLGLNVAVFYYDYEDVQSFATDNDPILGTITRLRNVGDSQHIGAEIESFVLPAEGLRLSATVGYLSAEIEDSPSNFFSATGEVLTFNGQQRLYAPEWSWTLQASYEMDLSAGRLRLATDLDGRTTLVEGATLATTGERSLVDQAIKGTPGYTLVNARVSYQPSDAKWEVSLYGRNLLDRSYRTVWGSDGLGNSWRLYGEPRNYGVEFAVHW